MSFPGLLPFFCLVQFLLCFELLVRTDAIEEGREDIALRYGVEATSKDRSSSTTAFIMEHGRRKENRHGGEGRKLYSGVGSGVEAIYRIYGMQRMECINKQPSSRHVLTRNLASGS